jgi:hypothetical protein
MRWFFSGECTPRYINHCIHTIFVNLYPGFPVGPDCSFTLTSKFGTADLELIFPALGLVIARFLVVVNRI